MRQAAFILLAVLTASCSLSGDDFEKSDNAYDEKATDVDYCETYAQANTAPTTYGGLAAVADVTGRRNAQFKLCMLDRGYREIP